MRVGQYVHEQVQGNFASQFLVSCVAWISTCSPQTLAVLCLPHPMRAEVLNGGHAGRSSWRPFLYAAIENPGHAQVPTLPMRLVRPGERIREPKSSAKT